MKKSKRKKHKFSLFKRYFFRSAAIIFVGFIFIGFATMLFIAGHWWNEKVETLTRNSHNIVEMYTEFQTNDLSEDEEVALMSNTLEIMSSATNSDYFVTDLEGNVIMCASCTSFYSNDCEKHGSLIIEDAYMSRAVKGGFTDYATDAEIGSGQFIVAIPVKLNGDVIACVFATEDAITGLLPYVLSIAQTLSYAIIITLAIMFIAMYFITRGITKPLEQMQEATKHFAVGEFDYRVSANFKNKEFNTFAKELNKMAYELSINDEAQKSFVANVSHELKTPMTTIGGFIDGILDGTIPEHEQKKYLSIVSLEVKRLSRMVVSMLNLSKIEAGEVQLAPTKYNVAKQIFETLLSFEKKIEEKKINIIGFEDMGEVTIDADRDLLQQVIYNLIDNAVKFTPENGTITVVAKHTKDATSVQIRNSGAGVSKGEIARIFERFYKVDKSRSFDTKGVGLGLYIVKTIINMHDGEISASSEQGEYTEFAFEIPFSI